MGKNTVPRRTVSKPRVGPKMSNRQTKKNAVEPFDTEYLAFATDFAGGGEKRVANESLRLKENILILGGREVIGEGENSLIG